MISGEYFACLVEVSLFLRDFYVACPMDTDLWVCI